MSEDRSKSKPHLTSKASLIINIISYGVFFFAIGLVIHYKQLYERHLNIEPHIYELDQSIKFETRFKEKEQIPNISLINAEQEPLELNDWFKRSALNIILATAYEGCDSCRNVEIKRWGALYDRYPHVNAAIVITDAKSERNYRIQAADFKSLSHIPVYFDVDQIFENQFGLTPENTPFLIFVDETGHILFSYRPTYHTANRSGQIASLFNLLFKERDR